MGASVLSLSHVHFMRDGRDILADVTWRIRRDQHWAVLGANGSGKTTLLNVVSANLWPNRGTVEVLGKRFGTYDLRDLRLAIGWVSSALQQRIHEQDTVADIIVSGKFASIGLYEEPKVRDWRTADELVRTLELERVVKQEYRTLSQGERQRVMIGRALMAAPSLLVLDEPCAGLDPKAREHLLRTVQRLGRARRGPALVFVTHHIEEIMPVFTHVLALRDGRVVAKGRKDAILRGDVLSTVFDMRFAVHRRNGRYYSEY